MEFTINRRIGKPAEFQGLKSQYLFIFAGGLLGLFIVFVVMYSSIYNIGRKDAETEFMELRHIETLKLQQQKDSLDFMRLKMEKLSLLRQRRRGCIDLQGTIHSCKPFSSD
jgi:hypothetical protein